MAKIFLGSNESFTVGANSTADVYGLTGGTEKVIATAGAVVNADQNVERVELSGAASSYTYAVAGNVVTVKSGATTVATIGAGANAQTIAFSDGSAALSLTGLNTATLGGQAISATATGAALTNVTLVAADKSASAVVTPVTPVTPVPVVNPFTMTSNAVAGVATAEGNTIALTITPTAAVAAATTLNLNVTGQALGGYTSTTSAADFGTIPSVTFAAGATAAQTVNITVATDTTVEGIEAYKIALLNSMGVEVATSLTGIVNDAPTTSTGNSFTLTTGLDVVTGNTTISGIISDTSAEQTWSLTDSIVGTSSTADVFNLRVIGDASGVARSGMQTSAVETVSFSYVDANDGLDANSFGAGSLTGVTKLAVTNSSNINSTSSVRDTISFTGVAAGVALEVSNNTSQTSVNYTGVGTATSADSVTLNTAGGSTGVVTFSDAATTPDGYVTVNIATSDAASTLNSLAGGSSNTTVNVTGTQALTITNNLSSTVKTLDASTASGAVTVGLVAASNTVAKGSTATTDRLTLVVDTTLTSGVAVSGFETVALDTTAAGTGNFSLTQLTGATTVTLASGTTAVGTLTLSNAAAGQGLNFIANKVTSANSLFDNAVQTLATNGTSDSLVIAINNNGTATTRTATTGTIDVGNYEVVTLTSGNFATVTTGALTLSSTATALNINAATNLVVGGVAGAGTTLTGINASGSVGDVTLGTLTFTGNSTYTGTPGVDSLTLAAVGATATQTFNTGAGNDLITVVSPAGGGTINLNTGDGDDTIFLTTTVLTGDVFNIDGGAGTADTIRLNNAANQFIDTMTGIEKLVNVAAGAVTIAGSSTAANNTIEITQIGAATTTFTATVGQTVSIAGVTAVGTVGATTLLLTGNTGAETLTGSSTIGTGITSGTGADTIVLGTNSAIDIITTTVGVAHTTATADTVTGFVMGAGADKIQIDISDTTATGTGGILVNGAGSAAITGALAIESIAKGTPTTLNAATELVVLTGTFADATTLLTDIGGAGAGNTRLTWQTDQTANVGILVGWYDGTNTHISKVSDSSATASAAFTTANLALTDIIILVGDKTASVNTANFDAVA
jgi:hypothetical protein